MLSRFIQTDLKAEDAVGLVVEKSLQDELASRVEVYIDPVSGISYNLSLPQYPCKPERLVNRVYKSILPTPVSFQTTLSGFRPIVRLFPPT